MTANRQKTFIFIAEDDAIIAREISAHLKNWGWEAVIASDLSRVDEEVKELQPDLILMDITLPFFNGYHWCQQIRTFSKVPVIFISSNSENMNIVMALSMGGDDFIAKPLSLDVLTAKIQALLRRTYDFSEVKQQAALSVRNVTLDLNGAFAEVSGQKVDLTKNEFRMLELLMRKPGKVVTRDSIMLKLWETDSFVDDNTLTVNISRLRKKLQTAGADNFILTRKGMGYYIPETEE